MRGLPKASVGHADNSISQVESITRTEAIQSGRLYRRDPRGTPPKQGPPREYRIARCVRTSAWSDNRHVPGEAPPMARIDNHRHDHEVGARDATLDTTRIDDVRIR